MDPDDIIVTVMTVGFYVVFFIILLIVFIKLQVKTFANEIPVVGWFISDENSVTLYNYKLPQIMESPYSAAIALAGLGAEGRKFFEHAATNSGILGKDDSPLELFMRSYNIPFKVELKGIFTVYNDEKKVNIGINMPLIYKEKIGDITVGVHV